MFYICSLRGVCRLVLCCLSFFVFFFSSRRRHTRWPRDWSSDVCSSDLRASHPAAEVVAPGDLESSRLRAAAHSVELAPSTVAQLRELAAVRGAQFPAPLEEGIS